MPSIGMQEMAIVLVIVIIIFGAGKLPELSGAVGRSIKEFKANTADATPSSPAPAAASAATAKIAGRSSTQMRSDDI